VEIEEVCIKFTFAGVEGFGNGLKIAIFRSVDVVLKQFVDWLCIISGF